MNMENQTVQNPLYPVFFKLSQVRLLIVGAGQVGHEKLSFILKNSPDALVTVVAPWISPEVKTLLRSHEGHRVTVRQKRFGNSDLQGHQLVIAATNDRALNEQVHNAAARRRILVNVADTPDLCDFYLGAVVTRGDLKIAISTNGKSPTFAKRLRQLLEEELPEQTAGLLQHLHRLRSRLSGNFNEKVEQLNTLTASLVE